MDKVAPFQHYFNPSLLQNPTKPKKVSPTSLALGPTVTSPETQLSTFSLPYSWSSLSSSGSFHFFDELKEVNSLESVKVLHARLLKMCNNWSSDSTAKSLIWSYLKFGDFRAATMVFFMGFARNYVFWNSFLNDLHSYGGQTREVLEVFGELCGKDVVFDSKVLTLVLKMCASLKDSWLGLQIHADLIKKGFDLDVYLKCALMNLYGTCWDLESANQVFNEMVRKEELVWNEAIMVNLRNERWEKAMELFREMKFSFAKANGSTIAKMLQGCTKVGALEEGKQIHGYVLKFTLESDLSVCNSLITMYSRNNRLESARRVFDLMEDHNLSSWNSIISSYAARGYLNDAWDLLKEMESSDIKPDIITWNCLLSGHALHGSHKAVLSILRGMQVVGFKPNSSSVTSLLQAVIKLGILNFGREIHGYVIRNGLDYDVYVVTSLLDMYVKHDCLGKAHAVFSNMNNKNIVAWNTLISGYSFKGLLEDARKLMIGMEEEGLTPDLVTWNGLISGYSMRGRNNEALALIHQIKNSGMSPDVVSWTALISGSSQNGNYRESLEFFSQMQQEGIRPNSVTITSLLRNCGGLSLLQKGKEIHCFSIKNGFIEDVFVATALIDMYGKSGNLKAAYEVFKRIENRTLASWNCLIMGFAIYGLGKEVVSVFREMLAAGILPDAITFTAVLSGCKNSGLVDEGWKYFDSMSSDYGITPTIEHYSCMVDLLGRAGYLDEAWDFIQSMPLKPDATIWGALLGSCRIHKNIQLAEIAVKKLFELEPYNSANYILMMNLYAMSDRWGDVERIKDLMSDIGVKNGQVWSWIQIGQIIHQFFAEENHPDEGEIYFELYHLVYEMKKLGYKPDVKCVYQNIDDNEKEKVLFSHTEKLAITYGLIKSRSDMPIRVIKNTRICPDCHTAAKYISLVKNREIFLRDGSRFHHFSEGKCSCNDCW
ncbi:pentatricopeptide repeat-containing protein At4g01030, mitochondrial [Durio zibethinus]|uniref:Pentatricopeptide repeat-containing protein At4g01030, mitochondrial n=1 Tax=Durio zibethinus TaxID=66656 RepID=A0A6P5ZXR1_DURZI|nr:pentatricopeptide repeat-containing protein At4g01030, mitochondrial [Durio zibethinus]